MKVKLFLTSLLAVAALSGCTQSPRGTDVKLLSSGNPKIEQGTLFSNNFANGTGNMSLIATDFGDRVSPIPPHDKLSIDATVQGDHRYEITVRQPVVDDPLGRFTTWWGVGLNVDHHGRSGIGSNMLPPIKSKVAVFGLGDIKVDGTLVAVGVMVHAMTAEEGIPGRLELDIGDPDMSPIPGITGGHLRIIWEGYTIEGPGNAKLVRYAVGLVIIFLGVIVFVFMNRKRGEEYARRRI